jgi:hypothetical protein
MLVERPLAVHKWTRAVSCCAFKLTLSAFMIDQKHWFYLQSRCWARRNNPSYAAVDSAFNPNGNRRRVLSQTLFYADIKAGPQGCRGALQLP